MAELRSGALDVAVVTSESTRGDGGTLALWSERVLLALPEGHPLTEREAICWTDLLGETVLLTQCNQELRLEDLLISKFGVSEDRPGISEDRPGIERHEVSRSIIKSLVGVVASVSLVLESDSGAKFSGLIYREIRDSIGPSRIGYLAHWRGDNDNPALASFLNLLRERYPSPAA